VQQSLQPGEDATQILADSGEDVARQLNEPPRETLQFETQQRDATPVLRRPVEPAPQQRTLLHSLVFAAACLPVSWMARHQNGRIVNAMGKAWQWAHHYQSELHNYYTDYFVRIQGGITALVARRLRMIASQLDQDATPKIEC